MTQKCGCGSSTPWSWSPGTRCLPASSPSGAHKAHCCQSLGPVCLISFKATRKATTGIGGGGRPEKRERRRAQSSRQPAPSVGLGESRGSRRGLAVQPGARSLCLCSTIPRCMDAEVQPLAHLVCVQDSKCSLLGGSPGACSRRGAGEGKAESCPWWLWSFACLCAGPVPERCRPPTATGGGGRGGPAIPAAGTQRPDCTVDCLLSGSCTLARFQGSGIPELSPACPMQSLCWDFAGVHLRNRVAALLLLLSPVRSIDALAGTWCAMAAE